jgi:hypothetical protein
LKHCLFAFHIRPSFACRASRHILTPFASLCFLKAEILFKQLYQNLMSVSQCQKSFDLSCLKVFLKLFHCHFYHGPSIFEVLLSNHQSFVATYSSFFWCALIIWVVLFRIYRLFIFYDLHFW